MGVTIAAMAGTLLLLRFPMWGSMLRGPTPQGRQGGEEAYYLQVGVHLWVMGPGGGCITCRCP